MKSLLFIKSARIIAGRPIIRNRELEGQSRSFSQGNSANEACLDLLQVKRVGVGSRLEHSKLYGKRNQRKGARCANDEETAKLALRENMLELHDLDAEDVDYGPLGQSVRKRWRCQSTRVRRRRQSGCDPPQDKQTTDGYVDGRNNNGINETKCESTVISSSLGSTDIRSAVAVGKISLAAAISSVVPAFAFISQHGDG